MTEQKQRAIILFAAGHTPGQVAKKLEVSVQTISVWRAIPEFRAELNKQMRDIQIAHAERLRNLCANALDTIEDCLNDKDLPPKERLSASFKILELAKVTPSRIGYTDEHEVKMFEPW